jgi:hypothetical protein
MDDLMQMIQDKDRLIRELLKELVHYKDSVADAEAEMLSQQATIIEQRVEFKTDYQNMRDEFMFIIDRQGAEIIELKEDLRKSVQIIRC